MVQVDSRTRPRPRYNNGLIEYEMVGGDITRLSDVYHWLLQITWRTLIGLAFALYLVVNLAFALLYWLGGDCVSATTPGYFPDYFWFSVQTLSTIGFGGMAPITTYAHVLVVLESFTGLVGVAIGTGLMFAKFSRPTSRILFSNVAVVYPRDGVPTLMFRVANQRTNQIVEARANVSVLMDEITAEGESMRRVHTLELVREMTPMFALTWTVMHPLDERSPLYGLTSADVASRVGALVIVLSGVDETFVQPVHARHIYQAHEIVFDERFADMLEGTVDGSMRMHLERIHDTVA